MGMLDIFKGKKSVAESNSVLGQTVLGNQIMVGNGQQQPVQQLLYVTTASATVAGRTIDLSGLTRNSTVMACVGVKARTLAQCTMQVMSKADDGTYIDAVVDVRAGSRDKAKAKQVLALLNNPNNFQSSYEFWYQWSMWQDLLGETFTLWWRKDQNDSMQTPIEMFNLDSTLITVRLSEARYPIYVLSTPSYGFGRDTPLQSHQVMHAMEAAWQGSSGFNKGILATELVALDSDIDIYANFVMQNGAKPSGIFYTEQVIPDAKFKEIAMRLKETWNAMTGGRAVDQSKAGQGMLLDQGMKYAPIDMLTLQDAQASELKIQTMKRICGLFGVLPAMLGIADQKYNNTQTMLDEFYKTTMYPMVTNLEQKLKQQLFRGYPNLYVKFDTKDFLKGAALDQMNFVSAGVKSGILTPNEAREYMGYSQVEGGDELVAGGQSGGNQSGSNDPIGNSPQDTGGGGGNQTRRMNIGTT